MAGITMAHHTNWPSTLGGLARGSNTQGGLQNAAAERSFTALSQTESRVVMQGARTVFYSHPYPLMPRSVQKADIGSLLSRPGRTISFACPKIFGHDRQTAARGFRRLRSSTSLRRNISLTIRYSTENDALGTVADVILPGLDLATYISNGPLLKKAGLTLENIQTNIANWKSLGYLLIQQLQFDGDNLSESERRRIFHYYLPVFMWCCQQLEQHQASASGSKGTPVTPLVIGISAPQGCGKTTVVESLEYLFKQAGRRAASISIDDFYLTFADQVELAEKNTGNRLLELRGNAGSHDMALGIQTLKALKSLTSAEASVKLPRYNKSANSGRGDRADTITWPTAEGPLDVILFEGWMLGFEPTSTEEAVAVDPQLEVVNVKLREYEAWHNAVDSWIIVQVSDPNWVFNWRLEAEVAMRNKGKAGMTDEQVADFVSRYIPAYRAYLPGLYKKGPKSASSDHTLMFGIDESRSPLES